MRRGRQRHLLRLLNETLMLDDSFNAPFARTGNRMHMNGLAGRRFP